MWDSSCAVDGTLKSKHQLTNHTELRICVIVEVDVLGSLSLTVLMVSVDVRQHFNWRADYTCTVVGSERVKSGLFYIIFFFFFFLMDLMLAWFAAVPEAHIAQWRIPPPPPQPFFSAYLCCGETFLVHSKYLESSRGPCMPRGSIHFIRLRISWELLLRPVQRQFDCSERFRMWVFNQSVIRI